MNALTAGVTELAMPVCFRLPRELVAAIDQYVAAQLAKAPGMSYSRNSAVRHLLSTALKAAGQP